MTSEEVSRIVHSAILNYRGPADNTENPKLDFKKEWKRIRDNAINSSDFVKDVTAIANTFGLDGFLIFGVEEVRSSKKLAFQNASLSDSGFENDRQLIQHLNSKVSPYLTINHYIVQFEGYQLSVIHIPPSIDKPHFVLKYIDKGGKEEQQRVFVRKGANNAIASRHDVELMYYDRKNIVPDYMIYASCIGVVFRRAGAGDHNYPLTEFQNISLENLGRRNIAILGMELLLSIPNLLEDKFRFKRFRVQLGQIHPEIESLTYRPLIIAQGELKSITAVYFDKINLRGNDERTSTLLDILQKNKTDIHFSLSLMLSSNKIIVVPLEILAL